MKEAINRVWSGGIMTAMFVAAATSFSVAQEAPVVKEARQQIEIEQTNKAVATLTAAVQANPADASLLYYLGEAQIKNGQPKEAEKSFQKGLEVNPKEALNLAGKGHLRMLENNVAEAKIQLDQALAQTKSKNVSVLKAVATAYLENDKLTNDALTLLQKAKSIEKSDYQTSILLGDAYTKLVKGGDAVNSFENAASIDPKGGTPQYKIGVVFLRSKNLTSAEEHFNKAIAADPNYALAYKELGELYYAQKKAPEAVKAYEKYLGLTERPEPAKLRYAFFLFMAKDYAKANTIFEELMKRPDVSATVYKYAAYSRTESKDIAKAEEIFASYFAKATKEEIKGADYKYLADAQMVAGKDSLALLNYKKSLELEKNPDVAKLVAETLFSKKKYAESAAAYQELKTINGKLSSKELFDMGRALYVSRQFVKADSAFADLAIQQPTITTPYAWRGKVAAAIDSTDKPTFAAKPYFDKVVEIATATPDKGKADLIQAYEFLGYYHDTKGEFGTAKTTFEKLKVIDPANEKANAYLKALKDAAKQQQQQKKKPGQS